MTAESILLYQLERISIGSVYRDWPADGMEPIERWNDPILVMQIYSNNYVCS